MKNTKIVALVAAVALLVLGTAFASFAATYNWYEQDGEWRCADKNGEDYYDAWAKSGDGWYCGLQVRRDCSDVSGSHGACQCDVAVRVLGCIGRDLKKEER